MIRIDENTVSLSNEELESIRSFIDRSLESDWDHHTNIYICSDNYEDGKRRMDPEMYDLAEKMAVI